MPNQRAGITVSLKGAEAIWGWWQPESWGSQNVFVNRAAMQMDRLENISAPLFHMYRGVIEKRPNLIIPEPGIRTSNARKAVRELADVREKVAEIEHDMSVWKAKTLRPYVYTDAVLASKDSFAARTELRSVFRSLNESDRREALQDATFRKAVFGLPPQASGMRKSDWDLILQLELEEKFPEQLRTLAHGEEAVEAVKVSARATDLMFANELAELGQLPADPGEPVFAKTFAA